MNLDFGKYYEAPEPGRRERAHAWATAIGLQDVDGLKPSKYLIATAKRHIEGEISQEDARRLVDEYYETKLGHDEPEDAGLHRRNGASNVGVNKLDVVANVVVNDAVNLSRTEECAVKELLRNPRISAATLATMLDVSPRQAQRIIASLKKKVGLRRRGADKNGEWYF